jgi:hypothetical protein
MDLPSAIQKNKCHNGQNIFITRQATRGLVSDCILGSAKPRQPTSSPVALKKKN